jgi:outer membrane protein assembly factor BamB
MFRGDPAHTGVYLSAGVERLGGELWRFQTGGPVRSSPAVAGDVVYVGSSDGHLYALDRRTGRERWRVPVGSPVNSSPAVARGLVLFGSRDGRYQALEVGTGRLRWSFATGPDVPWEWGLEGWDAYTSSPVVVGDHVLFGAGDGSVYALDLLSGEQSWRFATGGRVRSTAAVVDGTVFVGSADGIVYALDLATGAERWRQETEGASLQSAEFGFDRKSIISSPAVGNGKVYVGSRDGHMYALDKASGRRLWRADHEVSWAISSPAVTDDMVYSGSSDGFFVHGVDPNSGAERWRFTGSGYMWSSPSVVGGTVYIGDGGGYLRAVDRQSGAERWSYAVGGGVLSSPAIADGVVYFGSDDGHVVTRTYFEEHGYRVLDTSGLRDFMERRVADSEPSVIVFAMDHVPDAVAAEPSDTVLFRRFLRVGKVVWLGLPPLLLERDAETGGVVGMDRDRTSAVLGVDHSGVNFDFYGVTATTLGRQWGIMPWWIGSYAIDVSDAIEPLGLDENGRAAAWVKRYDGSPGTGFVSLGAARHRMADLPAIRGVAEYGRLD